VLKIGHFSVFLKEKMPKNDDFKKNFPVGLGPRKFFKIRCQKRGQKRAVFRDRGPSATGLFKNFKNFKKLKKYEKKWYF
jgi:hypothetical protein